MLDRDMVAHGRGGSIIMTASMSAHIVNFPQPHAAYCTSKAAVRHLTRCMAAEVAVHKIRVNSISPGYMDTRLNSSSDLVDVLPVWWERTPMGRIGGTSELIGPIVLLASDASSFMTGSDLVVDGEYTFHFEASTFMYLRIILHRRLHDSMTAVNKLSTRRCLYDIVTIPVAQESSTRDAVDSNANTFLATLQL